MRVSRRMLKKVKMREYGEKNVNIKRAFKVDNVGE